MKCDSKMMLKMAAGLGAALGVAYFALPAAQALILASVSVLLMVKTMNGSTRNEGAKPAKTTPVPRAVEATHGEA